MTKGSLDRSRWASGPLEGPKKALFGGQETRRLRIIAMGGSWCLGSQEGSRDPVEHE